MYRPDGELIPDDVNVTLEELPLTTVKLVERKFHGETEKPWGKLPLDAYQYYKVIDRKFWEELNDAGFADCALFFLKGNRLDPKQGGRRDIESHELIRNAMWDNKPPYAFAHILPALQRLGGPAVDSDRLLNNLLVASYLYEASCWHYDSLNLDEDVLGFVRKIVAEQLWQSEDIPDGVRAYYFSEVLFPVGIPRVPSHPKSNLIFNPPKFIQEPAVDYIMLGALGPGPHLLRMSMQGTLQGIDVAAEAIAESVYAYEVHGNFRSPPKLFKSIPDRFLRTEFDDHSFAARNETSPGMHLEMFSSVRDWHLDIAKSRLPYRWLLSELLGGERQLIECVCGDGLLKYIHERRLNLYNQMVLSSRKNCLVLQAVTQIAETYEEVERSRVKTELKSKIEDFLESHNIDLLQDASLAGCKSVVVERACRGLRTSFSEQAKLLLQRTFPLFSAAELQQLVVGYDMERQEIDESWTGSLVVLARRFEESG